MEKRSPPAPRYAHTVEWQRFATVVIYRKAAFVGRFAAMPVEFDGTLIGKLLQKQNVTLTVNPGEHTLKVSISGTSKTLKVLVIGGQRLEFHTQPSAFGIKCEIAR